MDGGDYSIFNGQVRKFAVPDYVLFSCTLLVSAGIGVFYALRDRRRNTPEEFLLGGHKMHVVPVALSLMVTFVSSLTMLGYPVEMYQYNTMFWWLAVCFVLAIGGSVLVFIPFFYRLGVTSTFEYLELRFNKAVRYIGSITMVFQTWLYMAFLLYGPALSLNAVTGINLWGCVVAMGVVVTFYTTLGGMKAVLWTDSFQAGVITAGLIAIIIRGTMVQGGIENVWEIANNRSRILFDDFRVDPKVRHSVWSMVIGGGLFWMALYGVNQSQVQRCLSCPSVSKAKTAMLLSFPGLVIIVTMACLLGVIMFAFYSDCDPIEFGLIGRADQLVPLFVMDVLGPLPGLPGIFVSAIVSASLSSMSSGLNALAAITYSDLMVGMGSKFSSAQHSTLISKLLVVIYGVGAMGLAWVVSQLGGILQALYQVFGLLSGPLFGVFTLGMFFPWANAWGAIVGQLVSTVFLFWVGMGAVVHKVKTPPSPTVTLGCNWTALAIPSTITNITTTTTTTTTTAFTTTIVAATEEAIGSSAGLLEPLYRMSYMWYTGLGMIVVWGVGLLVSFITGHTKPKDLKPGVICPIVDILFPCLPESWRSVFRCGVQRSKETNADKKGSAVAPEELLRRNQGQVFPTADVEIKIEQPTVDEEGKVEKQVKNGDCGGNDKVADHVNNGTDKSMTSSTNL